MVTFIVLKYEFFSKLNSTFNVIPTGTSFSITLTDSKTNMEE